MPEYIFVSTDDEYASAVKLFAEYAEWLNIDLSFQNFSEELIEVRTMYAPPKGCIILCKVNSDYVACVAVRPRENNTAELKRMYVKPLYQRKGIGKILLYKSLDFAKQFGYEKMRLDTLNTMTPAMNLYTKSGFYTIPAYYHNPEPTAVYFEKLL